MLQLGEEGAEGMAEWRACCRRQLAQTGCVCGERALITPCTALHSTCAGPYAKAKSGVHPPALRPSSRPFTKRPAMQHDCNTERKSSSSQNDVHKHI